MERSGKEEGEEEEEEKDHWTNKPGMMCVQLTWERGGKIEDQ